MGRNLVNKTIDITAMGIYSTQLSTAGLPGGIYLVLIGNADSIVGVKKIILN